jgi:D-alanyl-lipoteichoic acid acyltransferase DltB (MBOAT superfamily)
MAYLIYTCSFTSFLSGPVQNYGAFLTQHDRKSVLITETDALKSLSRIATGYFKLAVIAAIADYLFSNFNVALKDTSVMSSLIQHSLFYALASVFYTAFLYYNFSGYTDIVLGIGSLLGYELPENFNRPFSSKSFLEFWQRWHISMSQWFKSYLFTPIMMGLTQQFPNSGSASLIGLFALFVTFLIMGLWHGSTIVFLIYGIMMAAGACSNKVWQILLTRVAGKRLYKCIQMKFWYIQVSRGVTFAFFSVALTCIWQAHFSDFWELASGLGSAGLMSSFAMLTCFFAILGAFAQLFTELGLKLNVVRYQASKRFLPIIWCTVVILAVAFCSGTLNKAPEFVYKAF